MVIYVIWTIINLEELLFRYISNFEFLNTYLHREACHRKLWYLYHKLGNFILFKLSMESSVFNIAIKRNKQKYGAVSTVAMTTSKQCIVVPWKIPMQQSICKSFPIYWHLLVQGKKVPYSIFETRLLLVFNLENIYVKNCFLHFLVKEATCKYTCTTWPRVFQCTRGHVVHPMYYAV
jgi:hypothetical protein